ncbi:hypothetical protein F4703DRAFT_1218963 [Phycomyces blakesleeanus]
MNISELCQKSPEEDPCQSPTSNEVDMGYFANSSPIPKISALPPFNNLFTANQESVGLLQKLGATIPFYHRSLQNTPGSEESDSLIQSQPSPNYQPPSSTTFSAVISPRLENLDNPDDREAQTPLEPGDLKEVIDKCFTLCQDMARLKYESNRLSQEGRDAFFDFISKGANDILESLQVIEGRSTSKTNFTDTFMGSERKADETEYDLIRQARNVQDNSHTKYRRRSKRSMVGQRCHSCNTTNTPEWRRGPDGARTLCNACGLRKSQPILTIAFISNHINNGILMHCI